MKNITTVVLDYENKNRIKFQLFAEFLRFTGLFVDERCKELQDFCLNDSANEEEKTIKIKVNESEINPLILDHNTQVDFLEELFEILKNEAVSGGFSIAFNTLKEIFINHNLVEAGTTLQYFRFNNPQAEAAGKQFEAAAEELEIILNNQKELKNNRYVRYAMLLCWQKANFGYWLCKKPIAVFTDELAEQCQELIDDFPDFSNAWVLLGMIYELAPEDIGLAMNTFEDILSELKGKSYASSVYYMAAKRCEGHVTWDNVWRTYYKLAYDCMPKYRNIYKVASIYRLDKKFETALEFFQKCIDYLNKKMPYLDPLEQEYYYKIHVIMGYIYIYDLEDYPKGIEYEQKAADFVEKLEKIACKDLDDDMVRMYKELYCDEAKIKLYLGLAMGRIHLSQAYRYISYAYQRMNFVSKSEYYFDLANKTE